MKNPKKCPIICFDPDKKNNFQDFQNQRYIGIFMSQREREKKRERERARAKARARAIARARPGKEKGKRKAQGKWQ